MRCGLKFALIALSPRAFVHSRELRARTRIDRCVLRGMIAGIPAAVSLMIIHAISDGCRYSWIVCSLLLVRGTMLIDKSRGSVESG